MIRPLQKEPWHISLWVILALCLSSQVLAKEYTLEEAITTAQKNDPWITASLNREEGYNAQGIEAAALPDPNISLGIANLPVDSFDFSQEPMTQLQVGVSQSFPRGQTRSLKQKKFEELGKIQPFMRENRKAEVALTVTNHWLDTYRFEKTIELINRDRDLFEYLLDVAQSSYTSSSGKIRQQDLLRAQLELTRLDDRLLRLKYQKDTHLARLAEWLDDPAVTISVAYEADVLNTLKISDLSINDRDATNYDAFIQHPKIKSLDQKLQAFESDIEIAEQSYKAKWGIKASYGYRDETPLGEERADFFSLGVSMDLPLFSGRRNDNQVKSAQSEYEIIKTERAIVLRQMRSEYEEARASYYRLKQRKQLYETRLLNDMKDQAQASLSAYTNDDGDFPEAVRARIDELNARIDALHIDIDFAKTKAKLRYLNTGICLNTDCDAYGP